MEVQFLRESLVKAETAALDKKGELVLGRRASRRQKRGMAQTYVVTWRDAETLEETTLPIAKYGLGRKVPGVLRYRSLLLLEMHDKRPQNEGGHSFGPCASMWSQSDKNDVRSVFSSGSVAAWVETELGTNRVL